MKEGNSGKCEKMARHRSRAHRRSGCVVTARATSPRIVTCYIWTGLSLRHSLITVTLN